MSGSSLYPRVISSNPETASANSSSSSTSMYPSVDINTVAENAFPDDGSPGRSPSSEEQVLIRIPGTIVHLIEPDNSVELASGDLTVVGLRQDNHVVAVLIRIGDDAIQWPLARDEPAVKLDQSHYFFTLRVPSNESGQTEPETGSEPEGGGGFELLNYGVTIASKGQEALLDKLDGILGQYSCFTVQRVEGKMEGWEMVAREVSPEEMGMKERRDMVAGSSGAYWTALAPNVEDYSSSVARMIAGGSGQMIRGIIWCGDVTVDGLRWGNDVLKKRLSQAEGASSDVSPATMRRIRRVKKLTKTTENLALGILSGVVKVSGFFTSSIVNSAVGKKFFSLLPGEIILASLDGFNKICDAVEVAGKSVMSTSSVVTTGLVSQKYGEEAGHATTEGMGAAGHAIGTAWAVFKIRKALNPKSVLKPTTLAKAAAQASSKSSTKLP